MRRLSLDGEGNQFELDVESSWRKSNVRTIWSQEPSSSVEKKTRNMRGRIVKEHVTLSQTSMEGSV